MNYKYTERNLHQHFGLDSSYSGSDKSLLETMLLWIKNTPSYEAFRKTNLYAALIKKF